ncbi:hypothetical protein DQ04_05051070 [Trypanosoma grayi]|uniref:hypothetical protein n=1 Tax=Trypanosoma grayi TaxID=71804 RepID=UPI0004F479C1|nr:hypothetical protein DQ04_05051070 [Trypanosoma grayi]KEG09549.1 hypothetical protein DQ04_05051070 [Trypanosoma grayi]
MSGTHHLYTQSGRPMPPPPKRTPKRHSSVCRTPTRRYNPAERKHTSTLENFRSDTRNRQLVVARNERERSPDRIGAGRTRLLLEDGSQMRRRQVSEKAQSSGLSRAAGTPEDRPGDWHVSAVADDRLHHSSARWDNINNNAIIGGSAVSPRPARSMSPHGSEYYDQQSLTMRLRRSLSRGYSPQRGRQNKAVVGTELMAPMPCLQGAHRTSKNRDRTTIERFIKCQPVESQDEMRVMLEEYKGREKELCEALTDAYGDSWEAAVKGGSVNNNNNNTQSNTSVASATYHRQQDSVANKGANGAGNGGIYFDPGFRSTSFDEKNADRNWQRSPKTNNSLRSTPSRPQDNRTSAHRPQPLYDVGTPYRDENANRHQSLEKERYDDDVSPQPRRLPGGGSTGPRVGTLLDYREKSPRSTGMMTPPLPPDLVPR